MNITTRIAIRHLRSKHSFGFITFSTALSILGLSLGIASLIIISCISEGFNDVIHHKLSGIDGHLRIRSYASETVDTQTIQKLDSLIQTSSAEINYSAPYLEKHAILRKGSQTEGIILYGIPERALNEIFQLNQFTHFKSAFEHEDGILIGNNLAKNLNIKIGDQATLLNAEEFASQQLLKAQNVKVVNTFQTDFPEYDRLLAFIPLKTAKSFFNLENEATGLILNVSNPQKIEETDIQLADIFGIYPYFTTTWKERHSNLLDWLNIYDVPIKLIMIFITIVGIFNIGASLWMIIIEKTSEFGILQSIGLRRNQIKHIIFKEGTIIGVLGALGGILLSMLILYFESAYHFISLPNDIYFMEYLPIYINPLFFIVYPAITFLITLAFSYFPAMKAVKIEPSEALRYE